MRYTSAMRIEPTSAAQGLVNPCACGEWSFRRPRLLRYKSCCVIRCQGCGLLRTCPEPRPEELNRIYDANTSAKYTIDRGPENAALWSGFAREIMDRLERHSRWRGRLLDVGCDTGELLAEARNRGWIVTGVEPNRPLAAYVGDKLGVPVVAATLEEAELPAASVDAVVFNQVLEHVPDPSGFLREVHRVLVPRGLIFVGVPCFTSPIPLVLKRDRWYGLVPSEHIWQFGPRTLPSLIGRAGFDIVDSSRGCSAFWGTFSLRPRDAVRYILFRSVDLLGQGDFINVVARRRA
jgi:SAM-dependent methyltransferase